VTDLPVTANVTGGTLSIEVAPQQAQIARFERGSHFHLAWGWEWDIRGYQWHPQMGWTWRFSFASGSEPDELPSLERVLERLAAPAERTSDRVREETQAAVQQLEHAGYAVEAPSSTNSVDSSTDRLGELSRVAVGPRGGPLLEELPSDTLFVRIAELQDHMRRPATDEEIRAIADRVAPPGASESVRFAVGEFARLASFEWQLHRIQIAALPAPRDLTGFSVRTAAERRLAPEAERLAARLGLEADDWRVGASRKDHPPRVDLGWFLGKHEPDGLRSVEAVERRVFEWGLRVTTYDLGPAIVFNGPTRAVSVSDEWRGQTLADAFLRLDTENGDDVAAFFTAFGPPPGLDNYLWTGPRWMSLNGVQDLQQRLVRALQRWPDETPIGWWLPQPASSIGRLAVHDGHGLTLALDLWEAVTVSVAEEQRDDRLGFCEAPLPFGIGTCGRPFFSLRRHRKHYCSEQCQSRASTRRSRERRSALGRKEIR
jgi:hypothetical protein